MVLRIGTLCLVPIFVSLACAQNYDDRDATIQNQIDYNAQFANLRRSRTRPQQEPVQPTKLEDDPFVRNLFAEFLVQYQQLADEQKNENLTPTITTTTTEKPFQPDFSNLYTSPPLQPTSAPQNRRRLGIRRRTTTPAASRRTVSQVTSTTPFSTLLGRVNSLHQNSVESTTSFAPLVRQRFFGVDSSKPRRTSGVEQRPTQFVFQSTQAAIEELPPTTQPPRPTSNVKIPPRLVNIPSQPPIQSSKSETTPRRAAKPEFDEVEFKRQAESAKYEFASNIEDEINGNLHQREEVRDGLAVRGRYSFSDGFYKRTVHYEADDKGYRVIKEEVEPLEGPQGNPDGQARVSSYVAGSTVNYQITKDDILKKTQKTQFLASDDDDRDYIE